VKRSRKSLESEVKEEALSGKYGRQFRERLTRVIAPSIKGRDTNAKQWGRWTP